MFSIAIYDKATDVCINVEEVLDKENAINLAKKLTNTTCYAEVWEKDEKGKFSISVYKSEQ